jgi:hypothetical protein
MEAVMAKTQKIIAASSTFDELVAFLRSCPNVNISELDRGRKNLRDLYREIRRSETLLERHGRNAVRISDTVKAILCDKRRKRFVIEKSRTYRNKETVATFKPGARQPWSISETEMQREGSLRALRRGLKQELGLSFTMAELERRSSFIGMTFPPDGPEPSRAYATLLSHSFSTWYEVDITGVKLSRLSCMDRGVKLRFRWESYMPSP